MDVADRGPEDYCWSQGLRVLKEWAQESNLEGPGTDAVGGIHGRGAPGHVCDGLIFA